jgi:multidrug resistance efflux pump
MSYTNVEARQQMLDALAAATEQLARAVASLSAAYEQLDEQQADVLEARLFRPLQQAYGRAQRTHAGFADRHGIERRQFTIPVAEAPSTGVRGYLDHAVEAVGAAEQELVALQDSLMPIEVGDAELRAGMTEVRQLIAPLPMRARELLRVLGR